MSKTFTLESIRAKERRSHEDIYSSANLYQEGSWLCRPIKAVTELYHLFENYEKLRILDLGCGVGRNCIATAEHFREIDCLIECVDILDLAIEKLIENTQTRELSESIIPIISSIDDYSIEKNTYDWIMAVSALEHMDRVASFYEKLTEIRDGLRPGGIITLVINSEIREYDKSTKQSIPAQFEVNLPTKNILDMLHGVFAGWQILRETVSVQCYDIPRDDFLSELHTQVIGFSAKK